MNRKPVYLGWGTVKSKGVDEPIIFFEFSQPAEMVVFTISEAREMSAELHRLLGQFKDTLN